MVKPLVARKLHDAAVGSEVATEDREAARGLQRVIPETTTFWPGRPGTPARDLGSTFGRRRLRVGVHEPAVDELARHEADAARLVEVGRDVLAARLDVGDDRRARRDRVEVVDSSSTPASARSRADASRRSSSRPLPRPPRSRSRTRRASGCSTARRPSQHELHRRARPHARPRRPCSGRVAGIPRSPAALRPRKSSAIAIVLAVNCPPQAPAPDTRRSRARAPRHRSSCRQRGRRRPRRRPGSSRPFRGSGRARSSRRRRRGPGRSSRASAIAPPGSSCRSRR